MSPLCNRINIFKRTIHMGRIIPDIDPHLADKITDKTVNLKKIVTRRKNTTVLLPAKLQIIAEKRIQEFADKSFRGETKHLFDLMKNFKLPDDKHTIRVKKADIRTEYELRDKLPQLAHYDPQRFVLMEDEIMARDELSKLIIGTLEDRRRDWHYYEYDEYASLLYMAIRLAPNYSCLRTVMKEIRDLDPNFTPKSVLDFGSGMGTTIWAVNETWPNSVSEYLNIEISQEQQYLCEFLLREGKHCGDPLPGVFHRQYLPTSTKTKYDLVVAAFSMLELPNSEMRAHVIENLWHKTNDILVIIERGNRGGFAAINEARHFLLDLSGHDVTKRLNLTFESRPSLKREVPDCHVFAPCSHEFACPRAQMSKKNDRDICRFKVMFEPLSLGMQKPGLLHEEFSYIVMRKSPHPSYITNDYPMRIPRIVEPHKKSAKQITHTICCPNGNLAETTITAKKYGKPTFELAKSCRWGDLLPIKIKDAYFSRNSKLIKA